MAPRGRNCISECQGKVESSSFQQSRKFRFGSSPRRGRGNLAASAEGSRPGRRCKAEATESAPKAIGTSPPVTVGNRAEGFPVQDAFGQGGGLRSGTEALHLQNKQQDPLLSVRFPSRGFASLKRDDAGRFLPGFPY